MSPFGAFVRGLKSNTALNFEKVGAMRQVKHKNAPIASGLRVVEVAAVCSVFSAFVSTFGFVVLFQHKGLDALNFVFICDFKYFHCKFFVIERIFLLFPPNLHRKGVDKLAIRGQGGGTYSSRRALPFLFGLLLLSLFLFLVFILFSELFLRPVEFA